MEACSSSIPYYSSKMILATLEDWIPEKASWYLHIELVLLHSVGADKICKDRDLPQLIVLNGFYQ